MKVQIPDDCGNAPRIGVVADVVSAWARNDTEFLSNWLADDVTWSIIGQGTVSGPQALDYFVPDIEAEALILHSVITHGRLASCDGTIEGDKRLSFSHAFRFKTTAKTSKIAEIRTYCIEHD